MSHGQRSPIAERAYGVPAPRTPVQFDRVTGGLRIGVHVRRADPSQPSSIYQAYLSLLYAVRGANPGQQLPLRSADLEALLLIVGDDPATIEQRLVGLMGCSADEAKALSGILLRHRTLTATLGIAATLSLGAAAMVGDTADAPAGDELTHSATAPADTTDPLESRRPSALLATAPTAADLTPSGTTSVVVADADAVAVAPAAPRKAASSTSRTPARRSSAPQAPSVAAPAPAAPVAPAPAPAAPVDDAAPAPAAGWPAPPADDIPPPVEGELPDTDIGDPAYQDAVPPEAIGGIADPSIGHEDPVAPPDVALPFPNAPRVEVVIVPELVAPVVEPEAPAVEDGTDGPGRGRRR